MKEKTFFIRVNNYGKDDENPTDYENCFIFPLHPHEDCFCLSFSLNFSSHANGMCK